jgi:polar amino acid transport system substrate-binding protein
VLAASALIFLASTWPTPQMRWGADTAGGAPFAFYRPERPAELVGFEVEIAEEIARRVGAKADHRQNDWDALIPFLNRGDVDVVINGIEVTPDHADSVDFSRPYFVFQEELTVRAEDTQIHSFEDLRGKKLGTLSGAMAREMVEEMRGVEIMTYSGVVAPYEDLVNGRLDAVLLDVPIAAFYAHPNPKLRRAAVMGRGLYSATVRKGDAARLQALDEAIGSMIADGTLKRILEKWGLWSAEQERLQQGRALTDRYSKVFAYDIVKEEERAKHELESSGPKEKEKPTVGTLLPPLLQGAAMTVFLSVTAFLLAVFLGLPLALGRLYGNAAVRHLVTTYVEIARGTPPLIQLMLLYYGLPAVGITMPPITTAVLGLGMNYAAYESEVYRGAIGAIPTGQTEAALSLGMSRWQALRHVVLPQALRVALPSSTNDFIALFKDSSLVSVIAVVELTKTFSIYGAATFSYGLIGGLTAALYLMMSLPLAAVARRMERRLEMAR